MSVMMFPAVAGTINGNLSYNSDYVWRGVTQTQGGTSVHGQFEIVSDAGFYTGLYGAQVEFADDDKTSKELDYYAGFDLQVSDNVSLDTGYVRYTYDASVIESFEEIYEGYAMRTRPEPPLPPLNDALPAPEPVPPPPEPELARADVADGPVS